MSLMKSILNGPGNNARRLLGCYFVRARKTLVFLEEIGKMFSLWIALPEGRRARGGTHLLLESHRLRLQDVLVKTARE